MTDATAFDQHHGLEEAAAPAARPNRPARPHEINIIHARLLEAIETSEHYSDEFKAHEMTRLSKTYLRSLMAIDPRHVLILMNEGETVGIQITGPELGTLWLYWTFVFPEARKHAGAMRFLPALVNIWDHDRFHKIATYTKPANKVAIAMCRRAKFAQAATHEKHIFGDDYLLFERPLTKARAGYDHGVNLGFTQRLKYRLLAAIGL